MNSRDSILNSIRRHLPEATDLPELDRAAMVVYDNPRQQFAEMLDSVGGNAVVVNSLDEIREDLARQPAYASAKKVLSHVDGLDVSTFDVTAVDDPHALEDIDFAILPGLFGVAENAAVWVTAGQIQHRVVMFITQHLALVIPADAIVNNLHEAYDRVDFEAGEFSVFISGPSKTADIEQSLVIGAHGARSLTVYLLES
jgi:L-lactate dehydrogenase complex protein LldG